MREPLAQLLERTFSAAEREVIYRLIRGCGQVRHFATDPIPRETLQRILDVALDVPFVGNLPPWHIILVTSPALRANITAAVKEGHERDSTTGPDDRGQEPSGTLTREHLAEAPLHLAVTYDRGRGGPVGPDRAPRHSIHIYRICWAIQNLWLAACAEGLGAEWIRLADDGAVARLLALPARVQLIAYLCLGIPQAFHLRPRREAGARRARRGLDSRIYTDIWGQTGERLATAMPLADEHVPRSQERPCPAWELPCP
ncbi:MAG TPA: nitroreductase family protein [Candidatus Tectomicrobia bacterium]